MWGKKNLIVRRHNVNLPVRKSEDRKNFVVLSHLFNFFEVISQRSTNCFIEDPCPHEQQPDRQSDRTGHIQTTGRRADNDFAFELKEMYGYTDVCQIS